MSHVTDGPDAGDATTTRQRSRWTTAGEQSWWWMVAAVVTVGSLTVGQTILSIVGQAPEFFVAKRMSPTEIVLSAVLVVISPVVLALPVILLRVFSRRAAGLLLSLGIGLLAGVLALYTLDRLGQSTTVTLAGGAVAAAVVGLAYLMSNTARSFVRYLAPAPLVILVVFVFASPTTALMNADEESGAPINGTVAEIPIVMIVLDEMSLATIMDGSGELVSGAFPTFGRFAEDAVWYRNAVTLSPHTQYAFPSIMTGVHPNRELLPTAADHPDSIFSALAESHDLRVVEPITAVCAAPICIEDQQEMEVKLESLLSDLRVVGLHIVTPDALSDGLPPIDQSWADFSSSPSTNPAEQFRSDFGELVRKDRRGAIIQFRNMIEWSSSKPPLLFAHFFLPHAYWEFLEDGTRIERKMPPSFVDGTAVDDPWRVSLGMQRYLHVARYVDRALGSIVGDLRDVGIYDDALIVVASDHGHVIREGLRRRGMVPEALADIVPVPLFVKYPLRFNYAGVQGSIDDVRAELIDLVPTIFDVLGAESPYPVDGMSLLDVDARSARTHSVIPISDRDTLTYPIDFEPAVRAARRYDATVPTRDPRDILPPGADPGLIGTEPEVVDSENVRIGLSNRERYLQLDLDEEPFPAVATASVQGVNPGQLMGIMVDGRIVTLTQVHTNDAGKSEAMGLIPKEALEAGRNDVRMVVIMDDGSVVD